MINKVSFEYLDKQIETPFETFLKYTDEKEKSSKVLAGIMDKLFDREGMNFLDIGTGNGEYLKLSLSQTKFMKKVDFSLLEPSVDLIKRLRLVVKSYPSNLTIKIINLTFNDFLITKRFDVILASHLPLRKDELSIVLGRMLNLLKPKAHLIIVLRKKDEIYEFRTKFKSKLMEKNYQALIIDDALDVFNKLSKAMPLEISTFDSNSELCIPIENNIKDAISIIEFYLNKRWEEFPPNIQEEVLSYLKQKKGIMHQIDGFALVKKV